MNVTVCPHGDKQTIFVLSVLSDSAEGVMERLRAPSRRRRRRRRRRKVVLLLLSSLLHADVAPPDVIPLLLVVGQRDGGVVGGGAGQPEAVDAGEVVAGSPRPLTLDEGLRLEVCQTAT